MKILSVEEAKDDGLIVTCQPAAFKAPRQTGAMLAMIGRVILEAIRKDSNGNPALMEQAMAQMTDGFIKDMQLPDQPSEVKQI